MITNGIVGDDDIKIGPIRGLLGAQNNQLSHICTYDTINMWSKRKPIDTEDEVYRMNEAQLAATHYGLKYQLHTNTTAGSNDGFYGSMLRMLNDARNGYLPSVAYQKPTKNYRLGDFYDYDHNARSPISPAEPNQIIGVGKEGTFSVGWYITPDTTETKRWIHLDEMSLGQGQIATFNDWYFGCLLWNNTKAYAATQNTTYKSVFDTVSVPFDGLAGAFSTNETGETVNLLPFFSTQKISTSAAESINMFGTLYPLDFASYQIRLKGYNAVQDEPYAFVGGVDAVRFKSFRTSVFVNFAIRNNQYIETTNSIRINGYSTFTGGISHLLFDRTITIPPRSTFYSSQWSQYPTGSQLFRIDGNYDSAFYDGLTKIEMVFAGVKEETIGGVIQSGGDPNDP